MKLMQHIGKIEQYRVSQKVPAFDELFTVMNNPPLLA